MLAIILCLFRFVRLLGSGHQAVAVEDLALRLQLAASGLWADGDRHHRHGLPQCEPWAWWVELSEYLGLAVIYGALAITALPNALLILAN